MTIIAYDKDLNPEQLAAATTLNGPLLVVAGAGSGKTRTLIYRLARLVETGVEPERVLLLTFTRKAAEEMLERAQTLADERCRRVSGGTFHALAHLWLRRLAPRLGYPRDFTILDRADSESILKSLRDDLGVKDLPRRMNLAELFSRAVNRQLSLPELLAADLPHLLHRAEDLDALGRAYREYKRHSGLMDFDDLLVKLAEALETDEAVRAEVAGRYSHLMVDEYQDTNPVQARLTRLLAHGHERVMAVGDDSQSIYSFRGADLRNMLAFPEIFPGTRIIKLERNYRSTQPILDVANAVIAKARRSFTKCLAAVHPGEIGPVFFEAADEADQSTFVVNHVQALLGQGTRLEEMAVLFRAGYHSFDLEVALNRAGLGFVKYGGLKFVEAAHVKDVLALLKARLNPRDALSVGRTLLLLPGVGPKKAREIIDWLAGSGEPLTRLDRFPGKTKGSAQALADLAQLMVDLEAAELRGPAAELAEAIKFYQPYLVQLYDDHPRRLKDLEQVADLALGYRSTYRFLSDLALDPPANLVAGPESSGRLVLSTVHSAKGLEWRAVFVIWAVEGRFPANQALGDEEALEEERRMMYVAVTRAKERLFLISPLRSYSHSEGALFHARSRFLEEARTLLNPFKPRPQVVPASPKPTAEPLGPPPQGAYSVGTPVTHPAFGLGRVAGYLGEKRIVVLFEGHGHKTLHLDYAPLKAVGA